MSKYEPKFDGKNFVNACPGAGFTKGNIKCTSGWLYDGPYWRKCYAKQNGKFVIFGQSRGGWGAPFTGVRVWKPTNW